MHAPEPGLVELFLAARKTSSLLERRMDQALRHELGLSLPMYGLLSALCAQECDINQQEIADLLGLSKSSVSRQVDAAAQAGLLTSSGSPSSRREKVMELTERGRALVVKADAVLAACDPGFRVEAGGDAELTALAHALAKLGDALSR